jgi:hypothetical protein
MAGGAARVESVDALRRFKATLAKFAGEASVALADAESEMQRTQVWLESEQRQHWQTQIRKRAEAVSRAKEALRMKKLFKDSAGRTPSAVDEEKALRIAQRAYAEAEEKLANVRRSIPRLQKEYQMYKGGIQRFATSIESDIPVGIAKLDAMVGRLEEYLALSTSGGEVAAGDRGPAEAPSEAPPAGTQPEGWEQGPDASAGPKEPSP